MRKPIRRFFTLLELMVAMGVFAIIMLMVLQFFSGAQRVWASSERKFDLYGNARTAMDLMAMTLQTTYYSTAGVPFFIDQSGETNQRYADKIYFPTKSPLQSDSTFSDIFYVSFQLMPDDPLGADDKKNACSLLFRALYEQDGGGNPIADYRYAFMTDPAITYNQAAGRIKTYLDNNSYSVVVRHMTSLRFVPLNMNYGTNSVAVASNPTLMPNMVLIQFRMLSQPDFNEWVERGGLGATEPAAAQEFRQSRERQFSRVVYIGQYYDK